MSSQTLTSAARATSPVRFHEEAPEAPPPILDAFGASLGVAGMRHRQPRFAADTQVRVEHAGLLSRARLINVSSSGARLADLGILPRGELVALSYLNTQVRARVVWSNERQTGVAFVQPLSQTEVNSIRGVGGPNAAGSWSSMPFRELS